MLLAEKNKFPVLYIQPNFTKQEISLNYEQGELKKVEGETDMSGVWNLPRQLSEFSGVIKGIIDSNNSFLAYDVNIDGTFLQKIALLKNLDFITPEYALFPTAEINTVSSNKLENSLLNFISQAQQKGLKVEGIIMISDTPLNPGAITQIIFKPNQFNP